MRLFRIIYITLCCMLCASCSWVGDDVSDCTTGVWLQLDYTYNILDVNAAEKQIDEACVFVYDSVGTFIKQIQVTKAELKQNDYRIRIDNLPDGDYQFMVWSGLTDSPYLVNGQSSMDKFSLQLFTDKQSTVDSNLRDLFYGKTGIVHLNYKYAVHPVSMHKDVNRIACIIESNSTDNSVNTNVYTIELIADNTQYDCNNNIVPREQTHYLPYLSRDTVIVDQEYGERPAAEFSIATMRLLENDNARLVLKLKDTDYEVFNLPLSQYIAQISSLYELNGRSMTPQEYLDRQDLHTFIICLSDNNKAIFSCKVNNWIIRNIGNINF